MTRYDVRRTAAVLTMLLACACTSSGSAQGSSQGSSQRPTATAPSSDSSRQARGPAAAWPTYHGDNRRSGLSSTPGPKPPLKRAWAKTLDGAVYAQPLVVGKRLIVATEHDTVYALRRDNGHVIWRHHLGTPVPQSALPCGNIDPTGITGTPAYDRATGSIFVVTETTGSRHTLVALNWRNGHRRWHRNLDILGGRDPKAEQQRGALLVTHGRVYVAFGGRWGDCGNYVGYVVGLPTDGTGTTRHYSVPTAREAGIWAAAGPVTAGGFIYVASGNGAETNGNYDGSDSVIQLTYRLERKARFAPSSWRQDNAQDLDLGSSSPVPVGSTGEIVIAGKRGDVYLLDRLHGIGSQVATKSGCAAYGGGANRSGTVILPCSDGIRRLNVNGDSMSWRWQASGVAGSPVIIAGAVLSLDTDSGELVEIALAGGHVLSRVSVGGVSRFATPVPVGSRVYVGTLSGVVCVAGA
jgi:hypothetical protein